MKAMYLFFLLAIISIFSSCKKDDKNCDDLFKYKIVVTKNGVAEAGATVMCIFSETEERIISCNNNGVAIITSEKPMKLAVAMTLGFSGVREITSTGNEEIKINLENVSEINYNNSSTESLKSAKYVGTFGVYSTDGAGDVKFRYQGTFIQFYCSSYLPWLGMTPDPNGWTSWDLNDFLPWKGKKLLVPTRYQQYHSIVYGFSISLALFLTANI